MKNSLSDADLKEILICYYNRLMNQPENQTSDIDDVYKTLKERNIPIEKPLDLFLVTFKDKLTHIISHGYGIDVIAYRPSYRMIITVFNSGEYSVISEHYNNGHRTVHHIV